VGHVRNAANWPAEHQFLERSAFVESLDGCLKPRPLGPLLDVAAATGGRLQDVVERGDKPHAVFALAGADDTDALRHSLAELQRLGMPVG
jgi:hypothetical protein